MERFMQHRQYKVKVIVTSENLQWSFKDKFEHNCLIKSSQILSSEISQNGLSVDIYYVKVLLPSKFNPLLRIATVTFSGSETDCHGVSSDITDLLRNKESHRPKRLLVFINPMSGSKGSRSQFNKTVSPLFTKAGIKCHTIVTEDGDHARRVLLNYDLTTIDGVITVGGDGSIKQVVRGLFARCTKDAGIDMDDIEANIPRPPLPIGTIPCGTGQGIALMLYSTTDIETCALSISLGRRTDSDLFIVRNNGKFVEYGLIMEEVGAPAQCFYYLEKMRFLGSYRYKLFVFLLWCVFREFRIEVEYLPVCEDVQIFKENGRDSTFESYFSDGTEPGWKSFRGPINSLVVIPWSLRNFIKQLFATTYQKPQMSCADGKFLLSISHSDGWGKHMSALGKVAKGGQEAAPSNIVKLLEVKACKIKAVDPWVDSKFGDFFNNDGDITYLDNGQSLEIDLKSSAFSLFCIDDDLIAEAQKFF